MPPRRIPHALRRLARSRVISATVWAALIIAVAGMVNVIGIRRLGTVNAWAHWLRAHRAEFLLWRLCLYGATGWGWWWMRARIRQREPGAHRRLLRVEIAALLTVLTLEGVTFFKA